MPLTVFNNDQEIGKKVSTAYRVSVTQDTQGIWETDSQGFQFAIFDGSIPDNGVAGLVFSNNFNSMMINCYSTNGTGATEYVMEYQLLQKQARSGSDFDIIPMSELVTHSMTPFVGSKQFWNSNILFTNNIDNVVAPVLNTSAQAAYTPFSEFQYKIADGTNVVSSVAQHNGIVGSVNDALLGQTGFVQTVEISTLLYVRFKAVGGSQNAVLNFSCSTID